jgi:hypothetical protein
MARYSLWQGRKQVSLKCNAPKKAWNAAIGKEWKRRCREKQKTSNRNRPFGSSQERRQSSAERIPIVLHLGVLRRCGQSLCAV